MASKWDKAERTPLGVLRFNAGFTREALASTLGLSLSSVVRYENGASDIPIGVAEAMAVVLNVPFDTLRDAIKQTKEAKGLAIMGNCSKPVSMTKARELLTGQNLKIQEGALS